MIAVSGTRQGSVTPTPIASSNLFKNALTRFTRSTICKTLVGVAALGCFVDSANAQATTATTKPTANAQRATKITNQDAINAVNNLGKSKNISFGAARDRFIEAYFAAQKINLHEITKPGAAVRGAEFNPASKHEPISTNQKKFWGDTAGFEKAYSIKPVAIADLVSAKTTSQSSTSQGTATATITAKTEVTTGSALNSLMKVAPKGKNAYDFADAFLAAQGKNIHDILADRKVKFSDFLAAAPKVEFKPHQKGITPDSFKRKWGISLEDAAKQAGLDMSALTKTPQPAQQMALEPTPPVKPAPSVTSPQGSAPQPSVAKAQPAPQVTTATEQDKPAATQAAPDFTKMKCVDVLKHLMQEARNNGIKNAGKQFEYAEAYLKKNYDNLSVYRLSENPNHKFDPEALKSIKPRRTVSQVESRTSTSRSSNTARPAESATAPRQQSAGHVQLITQTSQGFLMRRAVTAVVMPDGQAVPVAKSSEFKFLPTFKKANITQRTRAKAIDYLAQYIR